ncbi:MAG TPA: DNA repair protein RadC [Thermoanaerobaculia bacterium]|nr:DNA repair protein RadC [Thermoanaerobaculia bacterium]
MTELIRDLPRDDRPRERLLAHGADTLSDAELLALLLGSGTRGKNAIQLARELLIEGMPALRRRELVELEHASGIGKAKAARIAAAFELARRLASHDSETSPQFDPEALGRALVAGYAHHRQERLGIVLLDSRRRVIRQRDVFIGTINQALVSTRDIVRCALEANATSVVLYHNHPSGDPAPSADDLLFTRKMIEALKLVDLELVDHMVIGSNRFYSLKQHGQL